VSQTEKITVTNYAPDRFARLEQTLASHGLKATGNTGEIKKFGADVQYDYSPTTQVLALEILHGPHLHNFDDFCKQLTTWVEQQA